MSDKGSEESRTGSEERGTRRGEEAPEKEWERLLDLATVLRMRVKQAGHYLAVQAGTLRRELDPFSSIQLTTVLAVFALFLILPIATVMTSALLYQGVPSLFWINHILNNKYYFPLTIVYTPDFSPLHVHPVGFLFEVKEQPLYLTGETLLIQGVDVGVIMNSLYVGLLTTAFSTLLGVALAFIMARYSFRGKTVLRTLLLIPLLSTPFVGAIGIQRLTSPMGSINILFYDILHIWPYRIVIDGLAAVIFIQTLHFFSLTYLSSYSAFLNIDPTLEESAENLGARGFTLFRKVTLPLALPGIEAGAILTFIMSIEDLGTPIVYEGSSQVRKTLAFAIFDNIFAPAGQVYEVATALGIIMLIIAIIGFFFIRRYMSLRSYAMLSKGGTWNPRLSPAKWYHYLIFYGFMIGLLSVALLPHIGVFLLAFAAPGSWGNTVIPTQFTMANFATVFIDPDIFNSIRNSLVYCTIAAIIIVVVGTSAAYLVARKNIPGKDWLDLLVTIPIALPGIVIAIGYLIFFSYAPVINSYLSPVIRGAPAILLTMSYTVRKMPFTVRSAFAGLQQTHVELEEAAFNLGAGRLRTFARIVLPLIGVSILAGAMMSFVYSMSEVSTSLVLGDISSTYAPITWKMKELLYGLAMGPSLAAVMGVFLMVLQIIVLATVNTVLKRRTAAMIGL